MKNIRPVAVCHSMHIHNVNTLWHSSYNGALWKNTKPLTQVSSLSCTQKKCKVQSFFFLFRPRNPVDFTLNRLLNDFSSAIELWGVESCAEPLAGRAPMLCDLVSLFFSKLSAFSSPFRWISKVDVCCSKEVTLWRTSLNLLLLDCRRSAVQQEVSRSEDKVFLSSSQPCSNSCCRQQ